MYIIDFLIKKLNYNLFIYIYIHTLVLFAITSIRSIKIPSSSILTYRVF